MEDDHYLSFESVMFEICKNRLYYHLSLPSRIFFGLARLARRYCGEIDDTILYYLTKGTVFDMNADRGEEDR